MQYKKRLDRLAGISEKLGVAGMALIIFQKLGGNLLKLPEVNPEAICTALGLLILSVVLTKEN